MGRLLLGTCGGWRRVCLGFLPVVLLLSACVTNPTKTVPVVQALAIPLGTDSKPIAFKKIAVRIPRNKIIGRVSVGLFCVPYSDVKGKNIREVIKDDFFSDIFREEFEKYNYKLVGNPDALFEDRSLAKAEFFVAGLIQDLEYNVCFPLSGMGDFITSTAGLYLKVEWQIYDTLNRRVVLTVKSEGSHKVEDSEANAFDVALENAFANTVQSLLGNSEFRDILTGEVTTAKSFEGSEIAIKGIRLDESLAFDPVKVRPGVVTIRTAMGSGSGFFISPNGFLLTNEHVVGDARNIRLILHSGRVIPGEVIRTDVVRDVALVKVGEGGMQSLSLSFREPPVGSEVLVYGTPFGEGAGMQGTLTKGIISAYRFDEGARFIQSDVNIQSGNSGGPMMDGKGNVIAITVLSFQVGGISTGQNFFIPLREAFDALKISIAKSSPSS